jgi:predicted dehydrogenase
MLGSGIEAVILTTPNYVHAEQAEAAAAAGLHVFCEKPMANSIEHADRIIGACRRAGVILAVGHQERRAGVFREMKRIIDSGEQGRPLYAEAHHGGRLKWPADNWRWKKDLCPGPMVHLGVHKTDVLLYLFGPARRVAAVGRRTLKREIETNDIESAVIEFDSGVVASCTSSYIMQTASLNLYLEKATLWYGGYQSHLDVKNEETWEFSKLECPKVGTIADELKDFARAVLGGGRPEVGGEEGRSALALALAIERSAELGRAVLVSEVAGAGAGGGA